MTVAKKLVFGCLVLVFFAVPATASAFTIFGWTFDLFGSSLDDGLVGHWTFDGKYMDDNVTDSSGSGNTGRLIGQTSTTTTFGVLGQALQLDGTNDYVRVEDNNSLDTGTGNFTYNIWIKAPNVNQYATIMVKRMASTPFTQTSLSVCTIGADGVCAVSKKISGVIYQNSFSTAHFFYTTDDVIDGNWHMVTLVRDGALSAKIYVDGVEKSLTTTRAAGNPNVTNNQPLTIGHDQSSGYFGGPVDDARVYNRALSASEIKRLYTIGAKAAKAGTAPASGTLSAQSGLVGHWTFDGKHMTSNVADASGNGNNGMLLFQTSTTTTFGVLGQALSFDGVDDYVSSGNDSSLQLSSGTVSAWIKTANPGASYRGIAVKQYAYGMFLLSNELGIYDWGSSQWKGATGVNLNDNLWHHVLLTFESGTTNGTRLYKDGSLVLTTTMTVNQQSFPFMIGYGNSDPQYINSLIDDVRVYDRILSDEEIKRLYSMGAVGIKSGATPSGGTLSAQGGLVGHWTFDGKHTASNVADASGQGNHGTLSFGVTGNTATTTTFGVLGQALSFDGGDDYAVIPYDSSFNVNAYTATAWAKKSTTENEQGILGARVGGATFDFKLAPDRIHGDIGNGSAWLTTNADCYYTFSTGEWYHVAYTVWENNYVIYVNGAYCASNTFSGVPLLMQASQPLYIGFTGAGNEYFAGTLDDVRVYNRTLSAEEIKRLYDLGQ